MTPTEQDLARELARHPKWGGPPPDMNSNAMRDYIMATLGRYELEAGVDCARVWFWVDRGALSGWLKTGGSTLDEALARAWLAVNHD